MQTRKIGIMLKEDLEDFSKIVQHRRAGYAEDVETSVQMSKNKRNKKEKEEEEEEEEESPVIAPVPITKQWREEVRPFLELRR